MARRALVLGCLLVLMLVSITSGAAGTLRPEPLQRRSFVESSLGGANRRPCTIRGTQGNDFLEGTSGG
jgi:hypothetical protein